MRTIKFVVEKAKDEGDQMVEIFFVKYLFMPLVLKSGHPSPLLLIFLAIRLMMSANTDCLYFSSYSFLRDKRDFQEPLSSLLFSVPTQKSHSLSEESQFAFAFLRIFIANEWLRRGWLDGGY